jgi:hypothetical protein
MNRTSFHVFLSIHWLLAVRRGSRRIKAKARARKVPHYIIILKEHKHVNVHTFTNKTYVGCNGVRRKTYEVHVGQIYNKQQFPLHILQTSSTSFLNI